jgi:hypothetical protein
MATPLSTAEDRYLVVYGSVDRVDAGGHVLLTAGQPWSLARGDFRQRMAIPHQAFFHHRSLFERHGLFDERYLISGDYELLLRELPEHDAMFVPDVIVVDMAAGGLSDRPESRKAMLWESYLARRTHGLASWTEGVSLSFMLFRESVRTWLTRRFGPGVADTVAHLYRAVTRRPKPSANHQPPGNEGDLAGPS